MEDEKSKEIKGEDQFLLMLKESQKVEIKDNQTGAESS